VIKKVRQVLSESKYFIELEKLIPSLDTTLPVKGIATSVAHLFKLADPKSVKRFSAVAPSSLSEHKDSAVRAMCARFARGKHLQIALKDPSRTVREAAQIRLTEVGETLPATESLVDLSKEYYNNIAYRLIKDYPDTSGDWINLAVKATVDSYRSTSGVRLDPSKLKAAVKEKFAELQQTSTVVHYLEEAIQHFEKLAEKDELDTLCDNENDGEDDCDESGYRVETRILPKLIRQRMLTEHDSVIVDGPKTIFFEKTINGAAKQVAQRLADTMTSKLRGTAKVSWIVESPNSISFLYKS